MGGLVESARKVAVPVLLVALLAAAALYAVQRELAEQRHRELRAADRVADARAERARGLAADARAWRDSAARSDTVESELRRRIAGLLREAEAQAAEAAGEFDVAGEDLAGLRAREREDWTELTGHASLSVRQVARRGLARHDSAGAAVEARTAAHGRYRQQMEARVRLMAEDTLSLGRQLAARGAALDRAHAAIDSLEGSLDDMERQRDEWRDEADPGFLASLVSGLPEAGAKLVVTTFACQQSGEACAAALGMAAVDAVF